MLRVFKRLGITLAFTAAMAAGGTAAASSAIASSTAVPDSQPPFNFCNDTGPNNSSIACFSADIEFNSRDSFTLTHVRLSDTANDDRAVYALLEWNGGNDTVGYCAGLGTTYNAFTYEDTRGYNTTATPVGGTHGSDDGISYVKIGLYACNGLGPSTTTDSNARTNPFY